MHSNRFNGFAGKPLKQFKDQ